MSSSRAKGLTRHWVLQSECCERSPCSLTTMSVSVFFLDRTLFCTHYSIRPIPCPTSRTLSVFHRVDGEPLTWLRCTGRKNERELNNCIGQIKKWTSNRGLYPQIKQLYWSDKKWTHNRGLYPQKWPLRSSNANVIGPITTVKPDGATSTLTINPQSVQ